MVGIFIVFAVLIVYLPVKWRWCGGVFTCFGMQTGQGVPAPNLLAMLFQGVRHEPVKLSAGPSSVISGSPHF